MNLRKPFVITIAVVLAAMSCDDGGEGGLLVVEQICNDGGSVGVEYRDAGYVDVTEDKNCD